MALSARTVLIPLTLVGWLAVAPLGAAPPEVKDVAGYFSLATVAKANEEIKAIKTRFGKDLEVDTFPSAPAGKTVKGVSAAERDRVFGQWVDEQVRTLKISGVYVLVTKDPPHLQVGVSKDAQEKAFPAADRERLTKLLLEKFRAKDYDAGLLDAVRLVREAYAKNLPARLPTPVANQVKDYAEFFKAETIRKADEDLRQTHDRSGKNVFVETVQKLPAPANKKLEGMTGRERSQYFDRLMEENAGSVPFAVFLLVSREPSHYQVLVGPEGRRNNLFTTADRDRLAQILKDHFGRKEFDEGLLAAVGFIRQTLTAGTPATRPSSAATGATKPAPATARGTTQSAAVGSANPPHDVGKQSFPGPANKPAAGAPVEKAQGFPWKIILWIGLGLLGLWIIFGVIRGLAASRRQAQYGGAPNQPPIYGSGPRPPAGQGYGPGPGTPPPLPGAGMGGQYPPQGAYGPGPYGGGGGGGGGFLTGMLGGMFGAAAGNWVYDSFFRQSHASPGGMFGGRAYGDEPRRHYEDRPLPPDTGAGAATGGYAGAGGDFDSPDSGRVESSGGDFGSDTEQGAASSGGDFGQDEDAGTGGDFGGDDSSGGEAFGGDDSSSSGGDFGGDAGGGGDFGGGDSGGDSGGGGDF